MRESSKPQKAETEEAASILLKEKADRKECE
jgi:hypothetical protein